MLIILILISINVNDQSHHRRQKPHHSNVPSWRLIHISTLSRFYVWNFAQRRLVYFVCTGIQRTGTFLRNSSQSGSHFSASSQKWSRVCVAAEHAPFTQQSNVENCVHLLACKIKIVMQNTDMPSPNAELKRQTIRMVAKKRRRCWFHTDLQCTQNILHNNIECSGEIIWSFERLRYSSIHSFLAYDKSGLPRPITHCLLHCMPIVRPVPKEQYI